MAANPYQFAQYQMDIGNPAGALAALQRQLSDDPDDATAHAMLGFCLGIVSNYREAERHTATALKLEPDLAYAHSAAAFLALRQGQMQRAERHLETCLGIDPYQPTAVRNLAVLRINQDKPKEAEAILLRALEVEPDDIDLLCDLAQHRLTFGSAEEARGPVARALELKADHIDGLLLRAQLHLLDKDYTPARELALWVLQRQPENMQAQQLVVDVDAARKPLIGPLWRLGYGLTRRIARFRKPMALLPLTCAILAPAFAKSEMWWELGIVAAIFALFCLLLGLPDFYRRKLKKAMAQVQLDESF